MTERKADGKRAPRFFCDNCGTEVGVGENQCPECGRYFSSIRCPKCGFSGEAADFKNGCPGCGYSARKDKPRIAAKLRPSRTTRPSQTKTKDIAERGSIPIWVYVAAVAALAASLAILYLWTK